MQNFDAAAAKLKLEENMIQRIKYPQRPLIVSVPVRIDNGKLIRFKGYRVQHSTMRGPAKGGVRFHPQVNLDEVGAHLPVRHLSIKKILDLSDQPHDYNNRLHYQTSR